MRNSGVDMWILGGFLGSGKTTILNELLRDVGRQGRRVGVLVNDFGSVPVDATLLRGVARDDVVELGGGQIFCACLSGAFVKSIRIMAERDIDLLLVESSGLAKPAPLGDIVAAAVDGTAAAGAELVYRGFLCVVDASRFEKLEQVVNAVTEQVVFADAVVVNKLDIAEGDEAMRAVERVRALHPGVPVLRREDPGVTMAELEHAVAPGAAGTSAAVAGAPPATGVPRSFAGWDGPGRPVATGWYLPTGITVDALRDAVERVAPLSYRIKGYVSASGERWYVSAVGETVSIDPVEEDREVPEGLTVITAADVKVDRLLADSVAEATRRESNEHERARS
ncbi:MAG: GTP-binding protein [bacterium]